MRPVAVLISDIHFSVQNLELASAALTQAMEKGLELEVPIIIAGDLLDNKAIIRAECSNRILEIYRKYHKSVKIITMVGNHDLLNEKGNDTSLNFLDQYGVLITESTKDFDLNLHLIPYQNDVEKLKEHLKSIPAGSILIMHQGIQTAFMGHYVQDKTSLPIEAFKDFVVVSGHYHRSQTVDCNPENNKYGKFTYIGSPYTMSFGEAYDGPKGFKILAGDGSLTHIDTNLRKHIIIEGELKSDQELPEWKFSNNITDKDLIWVKIKGPSIDLARIDKKKIADVLVGHLNFKFEKIAIDVSSQINDEIIDKLSDADIFDRLIDSKQMNKTTAANLKSLWKEVYEAARR